MDNGLVRINKMVLSVVSGVSVLLIGALTSEFLQGEMELLETSALVAILVLSLVISWVMFKKRHDHPGIKYLPLFGFYSAFTYLMFTSSDFVAFVFMFFIIALFSSYNNKKLTIIACIIPSLGFIGHVTLGILNIENFFDQNTSQIIIYSIAIAVFIFTIIKSSWLSMQIKDEQIDAIRAEQEQKDKMLSGVIEIVDNMKNVSTTSNDVASHLTQSVENTYSDTGVPPLIGPKPKLVMI